jgi:hypothetical protein
MDGTGHDVTSLVDIEVRDGEVVVHDDYRK